jgi:hypothetical protein
MTDVVNAVQVLPVQLVVHVLTPSSHDLQRIRVVEQDTRVPGGISCLTCNSLTFFYYVFKGAGGPKVMDH